MCGKEGHKSYQYNQRKGRPSQKPTPQANLAEQDNEIIAAIVEANLIENKTDWILDTRASRHFCTNRELLYDYEDTDDGECVFMRNSATAGVIGKGKVRVARLPTQYAYHFGDKTEWGAGNIITQDGIHSFPLLG
ncbi:ty1-copia retrotransposon protein [Cucumis melo var. makuwa]|uniref:Ty1-copia retrotransposon protein n=1 Tax=Cucumis melo var. makuwa TaxID=1194695 RepID=A0A5A7VFG5_CUCMM|nr:ty1-copia retrotransposon protein [Cucumis melo var. makuwa]TYK30278.1 ty1-copia retrotransposon protein [Cucumis melo var. makuwa]